MSYFSLVSFPLLVLFSPPLSEARYQFFLPFLHHTYSSLRSMLTTHLLSRSAWHMKLYPCTSFQEALKSIQFNNFGAALEVDLPTPDSTCQSNRLFLHLVSFNLKVLAGVPRVERHPEHFFAVESRSQQAAAPRAVTLRLDHASRARLLPFSLSSCLTSTPKKPPLA